MTSTRDEILQTLAGILDVIPPAKPPVFDKPQEEEEEEIQKSVPIPVPAPPPRPASPKPAPAPIPVPPVPQPDEPMEVEPEQIIPEDEPEQPEETPEPTAPEQPEAGAQITEKEKGISVPLDDLSWSETNAGSAEWTAENHPYIYFRGHGAKYLGYLDRDNVPITKDLLREIVTNNPELYYEWELGKIGPKLRARGIKEDWKKAAMETLIDSNPEQALILGIYQDRRQNAEEDKELLYRLWHNAIAAEQQHEEAFPGVLHERMQDLMRTIATEHPDLYERDIKGTEWETRLKGGPPKQAPTLSAREAPRGSDEWMAENYPHTYLRGQNTMKGFIREYHNPKVVEPLMNKIVSENPDKYFAWHLNLVGGQPRRQRSDAINFKDWLRPAIKSIVEKSPYGALMHDVTRFRQSERYWEELWNNLESIADNREAQGLGRYPEQIAGSMRKLAGRMATIRPDLYMKYVVGTQFEDQDFTDRARQHLEEI